MYFKQNRMENIFKKVTLGFDLSNFAWQMKYWSINAKNTNAKITASRVDFFMVDMP